MSIFINHSLYVSYLSFQSGIGILQSPPLNPQRPRKDHVMQCSTTTQRYNLDSDIICNDTGKMLTTSRLPSKMIS
jgi:hypothetical protein